MLNLNLEDVQETGSPVPDGTYSVKITEAQVAQTKTGGEMIKVKYTITEGPQRNRNIFDQFNIKNASAMAVQIGLGQLKGMMKAFGHKNPNRLTTTEELLGLTGVVRVKVEEDDGYAAQTRVKAYGKPATATTATTTETTQKAPAPF